MSTVTVTYFSTTLMIIDRSMRQNVSGDTLLFSPVCLCKPMDCSSPGFPVLHCLLALLQTHVHWVDVASQPSQPLLPVSPAPNLSQHQSFLMSQWFASGSQTIGASASVLPMNIQGWFLLWWTGLISAFQGLLRGFSCIKVQKHQFFSTQPSLWSSSYIYTWLMEKPFDYMESCRQSDVSAF